MRHGADVARAHGDDDVAIADHVLERLGELLDLLDKQRLELPAAAHCAADSAAVGAGDRGLAAAYTSVTHRASAPDSALPKSSIRSRVRV